VWCFLCVLCVVLLDVVFKNSEKFMVQPGLYSPASKGPHNFLSGRLKFSVNMNAKLLHTMKH